MIDSSSNKGNAIDGGLIKAIVEKNAHLTKENESLKNEIDILNLEVAELKEKLNQSSIDYESLDNKYQNLKMAKVIGWDQNSKKIAIDKIRGMVREIDYCISFLKNK
ncbi:MAG: hypothetical protein PUC14_05425 [Bacteroidales bacterium]|nr:hypothetical protein [Bacteroidales bacterium]